MLYILQNHKHSERRIHKILKSKDKIICGLYKGRKQKCLCNLTKAFKLYFLAPHQRFNRFDFRRYYVSLFCKVNDLHDLF